MKNETHKPKISAGSSGCTCGWFGPARLDQESQGVFTVRAYEAHASHTADRTSAQGSMFGLEDVGMFSGAIQCS